MASGTRVGDGTYDFSGGIDSGRTTTVQSQSNPNGLPRTMLAWLTNATVRGGGITQRMGWQPLCTVAPPGTGLYQGGFLYEQTFGNPYLMLQIAGRTIQVRVDTDNSVVDLSAKFGIANPAQPDQTHFAQGEEFLVIQAGDLQTNPTPTLPLFWDGVTLRRSVGLVNPAPPPPITPPVTYPLIFTASWIIPPPGGVVVTQLSAMYPGALGDVIKSDLGFGTFLVGTIGGGPQFLTTLQCISTPVPGFVVNIPGLFAPFTTVPPAMPAPAVFTAELPAAGPMIYYQGRMWYAQGKQYTAGDIVDGPSGTAAYKFRDSILKVTENPLAIGGDGFAVPDNAGDIRALNYTANDNVQLGQGPLNIFTRKQIYSLSVPVSRADWIAANAANAPQQTISQRKWGAVGDRCVVPVNSDLFYQTMEPAIRSLRLSVRNDDTWLNVALSSNENRILAFDDRSLLRFCTGIEFDNRLWMGVMPVQTDCGVAFQGIIPLDFDIISSFGQEGERLPPAWEGMLEGLDILQMFEGDFGGLQRAFAVVRSRVDGSIQVWEFTINTRNDNGDNRVTWFFESPAFTFGAEFEMKKLDGGEIWLDRLSGTVELTVEYRPDSEPCWLLWHKTQFCAARTSCEDPDNPICYPMEPFCDGYKFPVTLPEPQPRQCALMTKRPSNTGYQFQVRVTLKGFCRVRGLLLFALPVERRPYEGLTC